MTSLPPLFDRYLRVLGVARRAPGLDALAELVTAHVTRVPFENVSKLLHRGEPAMRLPPLERYLDGIEHDQLGGTCYANNSHLIALLAQLGYDARLCGADMTHPDVHVVGVVRLDGREFLVDGGYGAPFLAPMPLDAAGDLEVSLGFDRYVLHPRDTRGRSRMEHFRHGALYHGYDVNPAPRRIGEFAGVIEASFTPRATFMNALMIARFSATGSRVLRNLRLHECERDRVLRTRRLACVDDLPAMIDARLGIPADLARRALAGLTLEADFQG